MKKTILSLLAMFAIVACSQEPVEFSYNLALGETYLQHSQMNMSIEQEYQGQKTDVLMEMNSWVDFTVDEVLENAYKLTCTYTKMDMSFDVMGQKMSFSSDGGEDGDVFDFIMKSFLGKSFQMTLSNKGEVIEVEGFREILRGLIDRMGEDMGYEEKMSVYEQLNKAFGEDAMRQSFESNMQFVPDGPVKKGETWENKFAWSQNDMDMQNTVRYTFLGKQGNELKLKGEGTVSSAKDNLAGSDGGMVSLQLSGDYTQEITLDAETGWIKYSRVVMEAEGDNVLKQGGQEMRIPLTLEMRAVVTNE